MAINVTPPLALADGEACIAGSQCPDQQNDLAWVLQRKNGNAAVRIMAYGLRKIFRQSLDAMTVDIDSFQRALAAAPNDVPRVLVPIHRSYFDFLAAGYLLYARPDLAIPMPYIAAAEEFGKMPLVGPLLARAGAFFIKRGQGKEDFQLTDQIERLVANRETFEFFIEGTRSRSRQFLPPKRGLLRCLQGTQEQFAIFPIAISYDRVPEEQSFIGELSGQAKQKMTLSKLLAWYRRANRGEIALGRMHIRCAPPITLTASSDIYKTAEQINAALQAHTAASDFHLSHFCDQHPELAISPVALSAAIQQRGGKVIRSSLVNQGPTASTLPLIASVIGRSFEYQWQHWFIDEAIAQQPNNLALNDFARQTRYVKPSNTRANDDHAGLSVTQKAHLLKLLFEPVCKQYQLLAQTALLLAKGSSFSQNDWLQHCLKTAEQKQTTTDIPVLENALQGFVENGLFSRLPNKHYRLQANSEALQQFYMESAWSVKQPAFNT